MRAHIGDFRTERGDTIPDASIAYETFGTLNAQRTNAVLIMHALTGDAHVTNTGDARAPQGQPPSGQQRRQQGWWAEVVGPGKAIDTREFFVVCTNVLGGCSGSTGPTTVTDQALAGPGFPRLSVRDMARADARVANHLGIDRFHAVVGGSLGGARASEFALEFPARTSRTIVLAAPAYSSADNIAWAHTQIQAIELDPVAGLGLARQIAHLTYRSAEELDGRFGRAYQNTHANSTDADYYQIQSYLDYQAGKLVGRFDPHSYCVLTRALRDHDIRRDRQSVDTGEFHVVSLSSDRLYPPAQVKELADLVNARTYTDIPTRAGHDGFLTESVRVGNLLHSLVACA